MKENTEKRLEAIEARNKRVELDKAWEISWTRRLSVAVLTYLVIVGYLIAIHKDKPFINAFVPALGYFLSTLLLKRVKAYWQAKHKK